MDNQFSKVSSRMHFYTYCKRIDVSSWPAAANYDRLEAAKSRRTDREEAVH